jgi:hypothetical protein
MAVSALLGIKLTDVEIARAVVNAGVSDWRGITLVSIALAESGGYEAAIRLNPGTEVNGFVPSLDVGLWQISTRWQPQVSVTTSLQAGPAAVEAVRIAGALTWRYSWTPWHSYTSGKTAQFTGRSRIAINTVRAELGLAAI